MRMQRHEDYAYISKSGLTALEALAARMQAVFGGATERRESDNAYDYAKEIRAILAREVVS